MYFPAKKDIWFFFMFWGIIAFNILIYIFGKEPVGMQLITYKSLFGYIIGFMTIGVLLWIWFETGYKIEDGLLKIKYGPFRQSIKIKEIKKIRKVKSPFTSPSLSIHKLEILYSYYEFINTPQCLKGLQ
ncbi:PH domain-containing protein [Aeribacillus alveayuensis]|uniref:Membrane protein YdbT with pleckstrin-like domain n=1 Tax=Aeribacillus alveayuensis TaxID=279215 RepID=A0ABT9VSN0_9BACI|nr:putative membrane protein YdbT with pleckstrin-like domain [Bacillus alveayuensis]